MVNATYQDLEITDFSGGITDNYVDGLPNEARTLDNFVLTEIGKPQFRNGFNVAYDQEALQRIMGLFLLDDKIFMFRGQQMWEYDDVSAVTQIPVPNPEPFFQVVGSDIYPSASEWRNQLLLTNRGDLTPVSLNYPMVIYKDEFGLTQAHEIGLPDYPADNLLFAPATTLGATFTYVYTLHYSYSYTVESVTFKSVGFTRTFLYETNTAIGAAPDGISLTVFDAISAINNQINIADVKIEIYRTKDAGQTSYKIGEVDNSFAGVFPDENKDDDLDAFETIYTSGGLINHSKPPRCRFAFVVNDIAYYCSVIEELTAGDEFRPYRFVQAIPGNITGVDASAFEDLDDNITGGGEVNGLPIIFTKSYIYRIEGTVDSFGNGIIRARVISDNIGCVSNNSIVNVGKSLYFAGNDGLYVTDGYNIQLITKRLVNSYREIVSSSVRAERITGTYDSKEARIHWGVSDNDTENNQWWVLNLKTGGITTGSGRAFFATALLERDGIIYRGDEQGYIYGHSDSEFNDLIRDASIASSLWETTHIPFELVTNTVNFGSTAFRKWVTAATITTKSSTALAYMPHSINDDGEKSADMTVVRLMTTDIWDNPNFIWDDISILWKTAKTESKQRHMPRTHARCRRKQISLIPGKTILYKSDIYDVADVALVDPLDPLTFTATLPITVKWPTNIIGDSIKFIDDGYVNCYTIDSRTDQTITCSGGGLVPGVGKEWHIFGYNRQQRAEIKAISIKYTPLSREGNKFQKEETGANS
jgi:hypothetical protein